MTKEKDLKKEKKSKNGKASAQKGNLTDPDLEQESCLWADEKAGKKKRKGKNVTECLGNATNNEEIIKTKKKKKKKHVGDYKVEAPLSKIQEGNNKKKKKKSECTDIEHKQIEEEEELPKKVKKKRNKPREQIKEKKNNTADKNTSDDIDEKPVPKKHKKSKINRAENQETSEETGDVEGVKKNKLAPTPEDIKKTKKKEHGNTASLAEINDVKKRKNKSAESGDINVEVEKRKKKKVRKTPVECADVEETKPRKNKKSKQDEEQQSEENVDTKPDRKNRKRKVCTPMEEEAPCSESGRKRKKKKKVKEEVEDQNEPSQVDVAFVSVKNGNADEVTINQEGGQAFGTETNQASQPPKAANPSGLGQWSTAQFDSSEKQQKFLRLMGGFKKGFQPSAGTTARANMALGKDGQQQLQQKLLDEFDRAHSRRIDSSNRGAGIGFTAPANKKFFIDINAARSVRFDD